MTLKTLNSLLSTIVEEGKMGSAGRVRVELTTRMYPGILAEARSLNRVEELSKQSFLLSLYDREYIVVLGEQFSVAQVSLSYAV